MSASRDDSDPIDVYACGGCAEEHRTGREVASGFHDCGLGRFNSQGGTTEYRMLHFEGAVAARRLSDALLGWLP